jgi:hypothetical protein
MIKCNTPTPNLSTLKCGDLYPRTEKLKFQLHNNGDAYTVEPFEKMGTWVAKKGLLIITKTNGAVMFTTISYYRQGKLNKMKKSYEKNT